MICMPLAHGPTVGGRPDLDDERALRTRISMHLPVCLALAANPVIIRRTAVASAGSTEAGSGLRGGPCYGFQREVDDLAAVHLLAFFGAEAEFGVGEVLA